MTQTELLREAFDEGRSFTVAEALGQLGIYALSQRCGELARSGYPLGKETVTLANGKRVARYFKVWQQEDQRLCQQEGGEAVSGASSDGEGGRDFASADAGSV